MARPKRAKAKKPGPELIKMSELARRSGVPAPTIKHYIREGLLAGPDVRRRRLESRARPPNCSRRPPTHAAQVALKALILLLRRAE